MSAATMARPAVTPTDDGGVALLLEGYRALLTVYASQLVRTETDAEIALLLDVDATLTPLPDAVLVDLRPAVAASCQLAVRAGLRRAS